MKTRKTIIILIFSILITSISLFLFIYSIRILSTNRVKISESLDTYWSKVRDKENIMLLSDKINEVNLLKSNIDKHFIKVGEVNKFISYIEDMGEGVGSNISTSNIEIPKDIENIISFRIVVKGNFKQVMNTISFLENIPYRININQIYLYKKEKEINSEKETPIVETPENTIWQSDVSFDILSYN